MTTDVNMAKILATAVLEAVRIREESFDLKLFREDGRGPDAGYTITLEEAVEQVSPPGVGRIVYLALAGWWNDTLMWAEQVTEPTATTVPTLKHCQHGVDYPPPEEKSADSDWHCPLCKAYYEESEKRRKEYDAKVAKELEG